MRLTPWTALIAGAIAASACVVAMPVGDLAEPEAGKQPLVVATLNSSTTFYLDRDGLPSGPELQLVSEFAREHGWDVQWVEAESVADALDMAKDNEVHMVAAGLTFLPSRDEYLVRGASYRKVSEQVVCHQDLDPFPNNIPALKKVDLHVVERSSYVDTLQALSDEFGEIDYIEEDELSVETLLSQAAQRDIECVIADSNLVKMIRRSFPELRIGFNLKEGQKLGWYFAKQAEALAKQSEDWIGSATGKQSVAQVDSIYYRYIPDFDFVDYKTLVRRMEERLPKYKEYFIEAEKETGIPADLLAALSYQESHWNPRAVSPTGVKGLMMLTHATAKQMGVRDRQDPKTSIIAGAKYLKLKYELLPDDMPVHDRWMQALASYNIGRGHVLDARSLARKLGKNPNSWDDLRKILPLKSDKRYYPKMRHGYARGYEPVHYVRRIRNYRDIIKVAFAST